MSGLVLKLGRGERVLINGAVIKNGDRRVKISVLSPNASILRMRDAIHPEDVDTPVKRVCYIAQLILSGNADTVEGSQQMLQGIEQLSQIFRDQDSRKLIAEATSWIGDGNIYRALRVLRDLLPIEARLLTERV